MSHQSHLAWNVVLNILWVLIQQNIIWRHMFGCCLNKYRPSAEQLEAYYNTGAEQLGLALSSLKLITGCIADDLIISGSLLWLLD